MQFEKAGIRHKKSKNRYPLFEVGNIQNIVKVLSAVLTVGTELVHYTVLYPGIYTGKGESLFPEALGTTGL